MLFTIIDLKEDTHRYKIVSYYLNFTMAGFSKRLLWYNAMRDHMPISNVISYLRSPYIPVTSSDEKLINSSYLTNTSFHNDLQWTDVSHGGNHISSAIYGEQAYKSSYKIYKSSLSSHNIQSSFMASLQVNLKIW